ncbi:hypothetical protein ElyMa_002261000 [Elysia marginata]|uniref:Uncharacterized protein n=1 Tax=Elysia marginata TaxID=1093978 RepID=A0AAV4G082_9GAST|nr:hypothetical protein ElyMa_002261000 [Elysia marginata]
MNSICSAGQLGEAEPCINRGSGDLRRASGCVCSGHPSVGPANWVASIVRSHFKLVRIFTVLNYGILRETMMFVAEAKIR